MRSAIKSAHSFDVRALPEPGVERLSDRQVNGNLIGSCPQDIVRERGDKSARGRNRVIWREMKILSRCDGQSRRFALGQKKMKRRPAPQQRSVWGGSLFLKHFHGN